MIIVVTIVSIMILLLALIGSTFSIVPLLFISILIAILLHSIADPLSDYLPLPEKAIVPIVVLLLFVALGLFFALAGPSIVDESSELVDRLPEAVENIRADLQQYSWGTALIDGVENIPLPTGSSSMFSRLTGVFSSVLGSLTNFILIFVASIYLAIEPSLYTDNFVRLFPPQHRNRTREVLDESYVTLRSWILARSLSMLAIGILTFIGLTLIGMPLALTLAIIAGLLSIIPNIGPLISAVPSVLIGFTIGLQTALLAVVVFIVVQQIESYLITPAIQRETVSLPPALVMLSQIFFTLLFGWLGLLIAAPIVALMIVIVRLVYIESFLGDKVKDNSDA